MPVASKSPTYADCHGCSLCLLPCPMWRQHREVSFSPQGFAKAMQYGATAEDIRQELSSCIMCGACDVICPENIDLTAMLTKARQEAELPPEQPSVQAEVKLTGFVISCDPFVQTQLGKDDFYIIDAVPFHDHHADRVGHYTELRQMTGCHMNLDLNRMAQATGIGSCSEQMGQFDVRQQIAWLTQGRNFERLIVEKASDIKILSEVTGKQVIHIYELMEK